MADVPNSDPRVERRARRRNAVRRRRLVAAFVALAIVASVASVAFFRGPGDAQAVEVAAEPVTRPAVVAKPKLPVADVEGRPSDKARLTLRALYVVNYESGTVTKLRTSDMKPLQTIDACYHPIGITYDRPTRRVWVACYTGTIRVYDDR